MSTDISTDLSQVDSIASMPPNIAILKMENESIQALAAARPRNMIAIRDEITNTLDAFPILAESAIYSKPVGKVIDCRCEDCKRSFEAVVKWNSSPVDGEPCPRCGGSKTKVTGKTRQKFARGLSIRAAETLREAYGFNRIDCDIEKIDETLYKVVASFTDYQRGTVFRSAVMVPKVYMTKYKKIESIDDTRFFGLVVKAESSRAIREVVSRSINAGLKLWFEAECERRQESLLTEEGIEKMVKAFAEFQLTETELEDMLGKPRKLGWSLEDRKQLVGAYTALKTGETTVSELLGTNDKKPATPEPSKTRSEPIGAPK